MNIQWVAQPIGYIAVFFSRVCIAQNEKFSQKTAYFPCIDGNGQKTYLKTSGFSIDHVLPRNALETQRFVIAEVQAFLWKKEITTEIRPGNVGNTESGDFVSARKMATLKKVAMNRIRFEQGVIV